MNTKLRWLHLSSRNGDLPSPPGSAQQTMLLPGDFDGDGRTDFMLSCRGKAPGIVWYRPSSEGWTISMVEQENLPTEAGGIAYDIDGDGYPDIVAGNDWQGGKVYWWKNPGPSFDPNTPWKRFEIKSGGGHMHHDLIVDDFDGDGKPELVFWCQYDEKLYHAPIPDDPTNQPWQYRSIWEGKGEGLASGDIDGDGVKEILAGGKWFKHMPDGLFQPYVIDPEQTHPRIAVWDFNGDGRHEVVMVPGDTTGRLRYYECNENPEITENWRYIDLLGHDVIHGHTLQLADFNRDGNMDIFCAEMAQWTKETSVPDNPEANMWIFFSNGSGGFVKEEIARGFGVHEARIIDVDGDGWQDIIVKPYCWDAPRIDIWMNKGFKVKG